MKNTLSTKTIYFYNFYASKEINLSLLIKGYFDNKKIMLTNSRVFNMYASKKIQNE